MLLVHAYRLPDQRCRLQTLRALSGPVLSVISALSRLICGSLPTLGVLPYKCCVAACKSGYDSQEEKSVSMFCFPHDPNMRRKWLTSLHRDDLKDTGISDIHTSVL